jgi:uncharacterized protein (DUF305 family)
MPKKLILFVKYYLAVSINLMRVNAKRGLRMAKVLRKEPKNMSESFPKAIQMERVFLIIMIIHHILAAFKMASVRVKAKLIF